MRWHFTSLLSFEHLNNLLGVDGKTTVRVDSNTEKARVGLEMIQSLIIAKNFKQNFKIDFIYILNQNCCHRQRELYRGTQVMAEKLTCHESRIFKFYFTES